VENPVAGKGMRRVWCISDSIISPLGTSTRENYERVRSGESGVNEFSLPSLPGRTFWLGKIDAENDTTVPFFDQLCQQAGSEAIKGLTLPKERTLLVLSTTKGNISLIANDINDPRLSLHYSARELANHLDLKHYHVISNACISGVLALITAKRFINSAKFDHAVIVGADLISDFVVSGFESLMALSNARCRPFDKDRTGINLGEAAAAMVISAAPAELGVTPSVVISGQGVSNDANHISGPSRTGAELADAIRQALDSSETTSAEIDFASAHGTATLFNDEMEAKAFNLCGMQSVPVNSLKSYYGHTLGAAGVLESVIAVQSLLKNQVIGTKEFATPGTTKPLNVSATTVSRQLKKIIKTASGFGGCNAAVIFEKTVL
jgi:3-oxoacyl-[acyl-carrier-protein] synthase I